MFRAEHPHRRIGGKVDTGHCVRLVQEEAGVPHTSTWRRGEQVRGAAVPRGTAIATFNDAGRYVNDTKGASHAALFLEEKPDGLLVVDQWQGKVGGVGERLIRFRNGAGDAANDGDRFYVVTA
jgi:hypothetical protein